MEVPGLIVDPDLHRALIDGRDAELTRTQLQQQVWGHALVFQAR